MKPPRAMKTHLQYHHLSEKLASKNAKVIYGVRNIKDVLVSYYHLYRMCSRYGNMTGPFDKFFEMFKEKKLAFGDWFDHILGYWNNHTSFSFFLLKYEDLHDDFSGTVQKLADFLGKELTADQLKAIEEHTNFGSMKSNDKLNKSDDPTFDFSISKYMRQGKVGQWRNYFTEDQHQFIDQLCREKLAGTGLEFCYD